MFDEVLEWLQLLLPDYLISRGMWVDHPDLSDVFICSVQQAGGAAIDVDDRRPRYRVILLGPRNGRQHVEEVQADAEIIQAATMCDDHPCGAATIQAMTEPQGPGYTSENRAWWQVDLQVTF